MFKHLKMIISLRHKTPYLYLLVPLLLICQQLSWAESQQTIRFGVQPVAKASDIIAQWQPFVDYMSQKLGQPVEIIVPNGFDEMNSKIANNEIDIFYINSYMFYLLKQKKHAKAIAQMQNIEGDVTSRSEIFVRNDSGINKALELKGKDIAFISPLNAGGYLATRAYLYKNGIKSGIDIQEIFTKSMSNSVHGVLLKDYTAATVCQVNYKLMSKKIKMGELKIIATSENYPENVIAVRNNLSPKIENLFRIKLLSMMNSHKGRIVLKNMYDMKIKSFVKYNDNMEDITEKMLITGNL